MNVLKTKKQINAFNRIRRETNFEIILEALQTKQDNLIFSAMSTTDPVKQANLISKASAYNEFFDDIERLST